MRAAICWLLTLLCLATAPAAAERRVALIVANGAYANAALSNPSVDAAMVKEALDALGFEVEVVADVSLGAFDAAISDFALRARGADLALFYYAGHGFAVADRGVPRNYLMSVDADVTSTSERVLRSGGIPLDDVIAAVSEQAKTTLIFIDACRNDPRVSRAAGGRGRSAVAIDRTVGESVFVGLSTRLGDVALDGAPGRGSPFATAFAQKIGTPGKRLDDVFTDIRLSVEAETARAQRPDVGRYDLMAPVVLRPEAPVATPPVVHAGPCRDAAAHWEAISGRQERILFEEHVRLFPSCAFATLARLRLDEGADGPAKSASGPAQPLPTGEKPAPAADAPETECDRLASINWLPERLPTLGLNESEVDPERAVPACRDAVEAYPTAPRLALLLGFALEKKGDYPEALEWYEKAVGLGSTTAMISLSHAYGDGRGVEKDVAKAAEWAEKAVDSGNELAMLFMGFQYEKGQAFAQDAVKAREWYQKAMDSGQGAAGVRLGILYDGGRGVPKDSDEAARLMVQGIRLGGSLAIEMSRQEAPRLSEEFRKAFQARLKEAGVYSGAIDGNFGPDTLAAIDAIAGKPE